ncbi:MoaF C-terminal domain-containing protein [Streptomyces iconiensis]|uniref:MoaF C-terminal domain-containing protein n=1 Tax=Streptomyces iconiensis TaxID=1384038 RepID=A0ABT6ZVS4_9ACTN|nr:MoaF C-terminal domain-containing protein [Streptomyces iconiensis]MDJ1132731.1 MoaF C-terminal domain-containing protein [Streptomyces iconiensis]
MSSPEPRLPDLRSLYLSYEFCDAGLDRNRLPLTDELAGRRMELHAAGEKLTSHRLHFLDGDTLLWQRDNEPKPQRVHYRAVAARPDVCFVDWPTARSAATTVSLIIDFSTRHVLVLDTTLPTPRAARAGLYKRITDTDDLSAVQVEATVTGIGRAPNDDAFPHTTDLVGARVLCDYGGGSFEHLYLNEHMFCWHCVAGDGRGAADADPCVYRRVSDDLYLVVWREKLAPAVGMVLLDLSAGRSTGKLHQDRLSQPGDIANHLIGARVTVLNRTRYP